MIASRLLFPLLWLAWDLRCPVAAAGASQSVNTFSEVGSGGAACHRRQRSQLKAMVRASVL